MSERREIPDPTPGEWYTMRPTEGVYDAHKDRDLVRVWLEITEGECAGRKVKWTGWLHTELCAPITAENLTKMGSNGKADAEGRLSFDGREVRGLVEADGEGTDSRGNKKRFYKADKISENRGGGSKRAPAVSSQPAAHVKSVAARVEAMMRAQGSAAPAVLAAPKAKPPASIGGPPATKAPPSSTGAPPPPKAPPPPAAPMRKWWEWEAELAHSNSDDVRYAIHKEIRDATCTKAHYEKVRDEAIPF